MSVTNISNRGLSVYGVDDLARSGITPADVAARAITSAELSATGAPSGGGTGRLPDGYVIPYFDLQGESVSYYRVKFLEPIAGVKYRSPRATQNHIYFPPGLQKLLRSPKMDERSQERSHEYIIITEGEKKAACAIKHGFPAVAVAGVDSWRNRQILFPDDTKLEQVKNHKMIRARIPAGDSNAFVLQDSGVRAIGLDALIDFMVQRELTVIIIYDTDKGGIKTEVQRAAAQLGYELRYRGMHIRNIRQLRLPSSTKAGEKIGLDDFLMATKAKRLRDLIRICMDKRIAFPRHPNPKTFVAARLQKARLSRKECQDVSLSILMELEARGRRLQNRATEDMFYFDEAEHTLMSVHMGNPRIMLHETAFGALLYREFNLAAIDQRIVGWLAAQFNGEPGVERTSTHKVLAQPTGKKDADCIAYQVSDSHFVIVTPDPNQPFIMCENGTHGILFEQGQVESIGHLKLETEFAKRVDESLKFTWNTVLKGFNFLEPTKLDEGRHKAKGDQIRILCALLYYLSPWLLRWRGTQLPIELMIGEAGSGKTTIQELRQTIILGAPSLSNMTNDIRDWYAGITSRGGLFVLDNVHFSGGAKDYRQRLSDELCRVTTEPYPHVELRKLYTTSQIVQLPVKCTFALTAIEQPFFNTDLIQRAAIFELQAISKAHDAQWSSRNLNKGGGRIGWFTHHLIAVHKFLRLAVWESGWESGYKAGHRLANYEQALMLMAKVMKIDSDWIPDALRYTTDSTMSESDWTMLGIKDYIAHVKERYPDKFDMQVFGVAEITKWAEAHDTYHKNGSLTNPFRLGRYIRGHRQTIRRSLGMYEKGSKANRVVYSILEEEASS